MATFNINAFSTAEALTLSRFKVADIGQLAQKLAVDVTTRRRYSASLVLCLEIVLRRLASSCRWVDLEILFGKGA